MIFISYRIDDSNDLVSRLDDDLAEVFGRDAVFRDKTRLEGGTVWPPEIERQAAACHVVLVAIGPQWESAAFKTGRRKGYPRLSDPDDWVRKEITLALAAGRTVIPLRLNDTPMPEREWLATCALGPLADQQSMPLRSDEYDDDLDRLVQRLRDLCPPPRPAGTQRGPVRWSPAVLYPLQPAPFFAGRDALLAELTTWATAPADPARVVALVAAGGTGKTALAEKVLTALHDYTAAGVLVWSFYENPQTEAFLREACRYFTGVEFKDTGGLLERLQQALTGDVPHLLILDGLELVQATGGTGRPRGELEDPLMRRFVRWLAAGLGTRAKALITSRFPLPDLADWKDRGFRDHPLDDLSPAAALSVLHGWGVKGTDRQLLDAIEPLQDGTTGQVHALSLSALGSYLGKLWNGDVSKAPTFEPDDFAATDPKAAKLTRILTSYAAKLRDDERDLLARLSMFPRGVTVAVLGYLVDAGGEVAGRLIGYSQVRLLQMLEGLRGLGLVFRYEMAEGLTFTAHPFLREFFEKLHGLRDPKQIHEAVRVKLAPSLEERPDKFPTEVQELDRYERLIEVTHLAGHTEQAFNLFWFGLGTYDHLGKRVGDNARGARILSTFASDGTPLTAGVDLSTFDRSILLNDWALFAVLLGDLKTARLGRVDVGLPS